MLIKSTQTVRFTAEEMADEFQEGVLLEHLGAELLSNSFSCAGVAYRSQSISSDTLRKVAERVLKRLERELHSLLCGNEDDDIADRELLGLTGEAVTGILTVALTSGLGIAPAVAVIVVAIILKRIAKPTIEEACEYWAEHL